MGVEAGARVVTPDDIGPMVEAAFEGGASGVMISRNYSELTLANLGAVGSALRALGRLG